MRKFLFLLLIAACGTPHREGLNRWTDPRLWPVLEAREHRDTGALCALLKSESHDVRGAAALAFASVQDSLGVPCLLDALRDDVAEVRAASAFALTWVADTVVAHALDAAVEAEVDRATQRVMLHAAFRARINTQEHDAMWLIGFLASDDAVIRLLAVQKLARGKPELDDTEHGVLHAAHVESDPEVRAFLVQSLRRGSLPASLDSLRKWIASDGIAGVRISAIRALAKRADVPTHDLLGALKDPVAGVRSAALETLTGIPQVNAASCLRVAETGGDTLFRIQLLGLAMRHGDEREVQHARRMIHALVDGTREPYRRAAAIRSLAAAWEPGYHAELLSLMQSDAPPPVRQAAFEGLVSITRAIMARSRYATAEDQYRQLGNAVRSAIYTKDAGLICAAAELLAEEEPGTVRLLLPASMDEKALASLQPLRDLEAIMLLKQAIAKRDGLPLPPHQRPPFNHLINKEKLRALKQGQHYRIGTNKGDIIIATDVNECPGSSLAFDSLVTAGYYNGKYFHRMVPNFVVQGGCPRGDGYGGMPWTLRTEIGRAPFKAGSVGLASAGPDTESCQFFITHSATPHLDGRYTRFGEVVSGMDVVWMLGVGDVMEQVHRVD